jgi:DNA-binding PadR family transcriptional regulator
MTIRHALLALVSEAPKYGLQLQQEFESKTGEVWPLNIGQVYQTLQRLERDGLVRSDDPDEPGPQKTFTITSAGRRELADWLHTPVDTAPPPRDELVIKVLIALQMTDVDIHEIIQSHRRELVAMMQRYTSIKADASVDDIPLTVVVDAEIYRLDAAIRFLDSVDARVRRQTRPDRRRTPVARQRRKTGANR